MNKNEVLALLKSCKVQADKALSRTDLKTKEREKIENLKSTIAYYQAYVENHVKETDTELLKQYGTQFTALREELKKLAVPTSIMVRPEGSVVKVGKVIPAKEQKPETQEKRNKVWEIIKNILAILGVIALCVLLMTGIKSCTDQRELNNKPGIEQGIDDEDKIRPIEEIDIENYDELMIYAESLQGKLSEGSDISIEDIMYAIRLANFDSLNDKAIFQDRDEIYESTRITGAVASELGTDYVVKRDAETDIFLSETELKDIIMCATDNKISIEKFAGCKTENGYDIYSVADFCVAGLNQEDENAVLYAMMFNDLLARKAVAFTVTPDSPISTYYVLLGMYHENIDRILALTSGIGLTSVYGDGVRIDGYYGFTCVEELAAFLHVGNEVNMLYTDVIDQNITNHYPTR